MRALVVGTGSVGQRHIKNLTLLGCDVIAVSESSHLTANKKIVGNVSIYSTLKDVNLADIDIAVVANSTELHLRTALELLQNDVHVYIEKPVSNSMDGMNRLLKTANERNRVVHVGHMLRYHPNLIMLKNMLANGCLGEIDYVRMFAGHWLPDWRPGKDYKKNYAAFKERGGGVLLDLIHEFDLIQWFFGPAVKVSAMKSFCKRLNIETESIAEVALRMPNNIIGQIHVDYVRPLYKRTIEISGEIGILNWDFQKSRLTFISVDGTITVIQDLNEKFERNEMFVAAMNKFLEDCQNQTGSFEQLSESIYSLATVLACHKSSDEGRHISPNVFID